MWKAAKLGEIRPETERLHQHDSDEGALENPAGYREDRIDWRRRSLYRAMIVIISSVFTRQNACTLPLPLKGWSLLFCFALPLEQHLRHELLKKNGVSVLLSSRCSSPWLLVPAAGARHYSSKNHVWRGFFTSHCSQKTKRKTGRGQGQDITQGPAIRILLPSGKPHLGCQKPPKAPLGATEKRLNQDSKGWCRQFHIQTMTIFLAKLLCFHRCQLRKHTFTQVAPAQLQSHWLLKKSIWLELHKRK